MSMKNRSEAGTRALAELFHLVRSLLPKGQTVFTASSDMPIAEAIQIMRKHQVV